MFYDFTIEVMKLEEIKNELGQRVKSRYYEINSIVDWIEYKIYSLKGSDQY